MNWPRLSIIVPVFNLEEFLPNCINSILNQDFKDFELILINDGSTDNSGKICDNYGLRDNRVHVYHQENLGVSATRNSGIEKASGELICFVDGDDELYPNSLTKIIEISVTSKSEMIVAKSFLYHRSQIKNERYEFDDSFLDRAFDGYNLIIEKAYIRGSVCGCIFNREFLLINKLRFPVGVMIGEDGIFISLVHLYAQNISFVDQIFYLANEREGSASRSWSFEKVYKMKDNIKYINNYFKEHPNLNTCQKQLLDYRIYKNISAIFNQLYFCFSIVNYLKLLKAIRKELKRKLNTGYIPISERKVRVLNFSLILFSFTVLINQGFRNLLK